MSHQKQIPVDIIQGKISNHPKIVKTLSLLWGSQEIYSYFNDLFTNSREQRNGFDPDVFFELAKIYKEHQLQFPSNQTPQVWH